MPLKLGKLHDELRTVSFRFLGEQVNVRYPLSALGPDLQMWIQSRTKDNDDESFAIEWITRVVTSWDLEDDEGNVLPATKEVILEYQLPTPFLSAVMQEVIADSNPKEMRTSAQNSGGSSLRGKGH